MRGWLILLLFLTLLSASLAYAQNTDAPIMPQVTDPALAQQHPAPGAADTVSLENTPVPMPTYEPQKFAVLQTLDKITARTKSVTVPVGKAVAVGPLFLDVKLCQKTPPTEQPEATAFIQIWEATPPLKVKRKNQADDRATPSQWVFSGWMFASSPALSAVEHPIYDVWLKDCISDPKRVSP